MNFHRRNLLGLVSILSGFTLAGGIGAQAFAASDSNKWRLEVSGGANEDGTIQLRITASDGEVFDVTVEIPDGAGENHVARIIRDTLKENLPGDRFHIERDDGEDVLIKHRIGEDDFTVEIIDENIKGTRLHLQKE